MPQEEDAKKALSEEILSSARKQAERAVKRAERQAASTEKGARQQAGEFVEQALTVVRARMEFERRKSDALTEIEASRLLLATREAAVQDVFDAALKRAESLSDDELAETASFLAEEAVGGVPSDDVIILLPAGWLSRLGEAGARSLADGVVARGLAAKAEVKGGDVPGGQGLVVVSTDGRLRYDNSLSHRLGRMRSILRSRVAALILKDDASSDGK
ncbi:MAG TPA: hypothetical protein PL033_18520 [Candidatus Brocadiia bacterium]|nr:hypothetical protein [Candidatus Brocadiia bacterium]